MTSRHAVLIGLLLAAGCEAKAGGISSDRLSKKWESCAATRDCAGELRCIDAVCKSQDRTDVGDYLVASGLAAIERGEIDYAIAQLTEAERQYLNEKIEVPADVHCALGAALVKLRKDQVKAEEAARRLHRCVQNLPDGSSMRAEGLASLAALGEVGFDPVHLGRDEVADRYLTKAPRKPPTEDLQLTATANPTSNRKAFEKWMSALSSARIKKALVPCYEQWWKATRKEELQVTLPFKYRFRLHPDRAALDRGILKIEELEPAADADVAAATQCAANALGPIASEIGEDYPDGRWESKITLAIQP